ncbi:MAG: 4-hydroxybenzoate 3-monooxygenase [Mesorhizobium sp.]|uniref:4-hydroxybenzoate 3-monooxygenase n=1 Tax=Mesorhizobium sp. TaxID=1871066 RepID=UPI000FE70DE9|nr:4-hydroxybenzoate 3-monooxygenase [Mesorhizobium sp.]RWE80635.1 MAG: 4-hydroxybenzoate 3-monooxygenase [Mesorhizobium sp.]TJW65420.1 MAG: 4-hydroxybenzoate 3-monooxygenase [Mesorhizobium sp.]
MTSTSEETTVIIVGAGVSGLTLASFLRTSGVACVVLERIDRARVEVRQRAGVVDARAVRMFEQWGLADKLLAGPLAQTIDYRVNGVGRIFETIEDDGSPGRFCTQQMLVNNLLRELIDVMAGDIRFSVTDVSIQNDEDRRPRVSYSDAAGAHEFVCDYIIGCDAEHGVSRASIPDGVLTKYSHDFGYAWLAALVEAPVTGHPIMGVSDHGFVAQLPRGPHRSRYYLQCAFSDGPADWPDTRIWDEIRLRLCDNTIENAVVHDKDFVPMRSVVYAPMQYRNLFLVGDAAHLLPPTGAKGMNLALYDVDVLAQALVRAARDRDRAALDAYSSTVLPHIWKYQEFSAWMTDTMHDAGDPTQNGTFRQMAARARLDNLFDSPTAARLHSEYQRGLN